MSTHAGPSTADYLQRRVPASRLEELARRRRSPPAGRGPAPWSAPSARQTAAAEPSAADFFVPSLPGQPAGSQLTLFAGHLPFYPLSAPEGSSDAHAWFYLAKARHIADKPLFILWLNGGPGCSSMDGGMMEIGPLRMVPKGDGQLREAEGAWNEYANVLFLDQPTGTGYSYGSTRDYVHELDAVGQNVVNFLERFYKVFPEYEAMDTYIAGESYAGQYIPYIADAITKTSLVSTPLKGLLIGNGWIDPAAQYMAYHDFAFDAGLLERNSAAGKKVMAEVNKCNQTLNQLQDEGSPIHIHIPVCEGILSSITDSTVQTVNSQKMCLNMYDVRLVDTFPACGMNWPPDLADITPYLSRSEVKTAFHASAKEGDWAECNGNVGANMWVKTSRPSVDLLPGLLERMKVMLFSGDQDLICCHVGTEKLIDRLTWNGKRGFTEDSTVEPWEVGGEPAGTWREERGLTYVKIANASHMAPYDVPLVAHDMLARFAGLNFLAAAGPASTVPSRIGSESESILGTVNASAPGSEGSAGKALDDRPSVADAASDAFSEHYYNAGSAGLILVLVAAAVGVFACYRRRLRRAGRGDFASGSGLMRKRSASLPHHVKGGQVGLPDDGPHELDELVVDGDYRDGNGNGDGAAGQKKGKSRARDLDEGETMFALGDEDEETDDEEKKGDLGRGDEKRPRGQS